MKIALFVHGNINENYKSWGFIDELNCDVFLPNNNEDSFINQWIDCLNQTEEVEEVYDIIILSKCDNEFNPTTNYQNFLTYTKDSALYSTRSIYYLSLDELWIDERFFIGNGNVINNLITSLPIDGDKKTLGNKIVDLGYYVDVVRDIEIKTKKL
jgi:hypothetical protein